MLLAGLDQCVSAFRNGDMSACKPLGFGVVDWIAVVTFIGGIGIGAVKGVRTVARWIRRRRDSINSFDDLRSKLQPLVQDNTRIFRDFAPNSGAAAAGETLRTDVSAWRTVRREIAQNNDRIAQLIKDHREVVPAEYRDLFAAWLSHIDAFRAHLSDETVDYRQHQFPRGVLKLFDDV